MKDRDEPSLEINSSRDTQEEKPSGDKKTLKKSSNKILWVVLVVLVIGLISFIATNNDIFHLSMSMSSTAAPSCRSSSVSDIQYGASAYSNCHTPTKERQDEKRWQDILEASPVVIAVSSVVTALGLIALTWQVSKLVKAVSNRE